jgi:hypothetical protein
VTVLLVPVGKTPYQDVRALAEAVVSRLAQEGRICLIDAYGSSDPDSRSGGELSLDQASALARNSVWPPPSPVLEVKGWRADVYAGGELHIAADVVSLTYLVRSLGITTVIIGPAFDTDLLWLYDGFGLALPDRLVLVASGDHLAHTVDPLLQLLSEDRRGPSPDHIGCVRLPPSEGDWSKGRQDDLTALSRLLDDQLGLSRWFGDEDGGGRLVSDEGVPGLARFLGLSESADDQALVDALHAAEASAALSHQRFRLEQLSSCIPDADPAAGKQLADVLIESVALTHKHVSALRREVEGIYEPEGVYSFWIRLLHVTGQEAPSLAASLPARRLRDLLLAVVEVFALSYDEPCADPPVAVDRVGELAWVVLQQLQEGREPALSRMTVAYADTLSPELGLAIRDYPSWREAALGRPAD